ncbi:MAG: phospholipase D family protein, partial [Gammaproteobacteria bacterium]|nr:phospholipase D family protein [Gammaproteobacteria bacterium]
MTNPSPFVCLNILTLSMILSGCELAANTAEQAEITPVRPAHWIDNQISKQQMNEGKTAFLPLYDGFMSMAARL